ncbi:hypothetical protein ACFQV5_16305 [Paenibacillus sp. GCM10028914]
MHYCNKNYRQCEIAALQLAVSTAWSSFAAPLARFTVYLDTKKGCYALGLEHSIPFFD